MQVVGCKLWLGLGWHHAAWYSCCCRFCCGSCRAAEHSSFVLVGGVSATSEMCLTGLENVGASLSDCGAAVAELDGREIWSLSAGGALTSLASKQCLAVPSGAVAGARVAVAPCDGPDASTAWELQGNGQIKLGSSNVLESKRVRSW